MPDPREVLPDELEDDDAGGGSRWYLMALAIPLMVVLGLVALALVPGGGGAKAGGIGPGEVFPEIQAGAWINGNPPSAEDLKGRVFVVDLWASWCIPCREMTPMVVALHEKYKDRGVEFIGLSVEDGRAEEEMKDFLASANVTWPNGYDAMETIDQLRTEGYIPRMWVVGRDGKVIWNFDSRERPEIAIERELARK